MKIDELSIEYMSLISFILKTRDDVQYYWNPDAEFKIHFQTIQSKKRHLFNSRKKYSNNQRTLLGIFYKLYLYLGKSVSEKTLCHHNSLHENIYLSR